VGWLVREGRLDALLLNLCAFFVSAFRQLTP
jgi:hypothetical protein